MAIVSVQRFHLTLKSSLALISFLVSATWGAVHFLAVKPITKEIEDKDRALSRLESDRNATSAGMMALQARYDETVKSLSAPQILFPVNAGSLLGGGVTFEWNYSGSKGVAGYVLEIRDLTKQSPPLYKGVARPETLREYLDTGVRTEGEFLWRVRPGVLIGDKLVPQGPWSNPAIYSMYPNVYQRVLKTGRIRVASTPTAYDDFLAVDGRGGYRGFEYDLLLWIVEEISQQMKLPSVPAVEFVEIPWDRLFLAVHNGEVDIAIRSITRSAHREREHKNIKFSDGYLKNHQIIIQRSSSNKYPDGLRDATVGVKANSINQRAAQELAKKFRWRIDSSYLSYGDIYQALQEGRIDFGLVDSVLAAKFLRTRFTQLGPELDSELETFYLTELGRKEEEYAIAFHEGQAESRLRDAMNFAISSAKGAEKIRELKAKYGLE